MQELTTEVWKQGGRTHDLHHPPVAVSAWSERSASEPANGILVVSLDSANAHDIQIGLPVADQNIRLWQVVSRDDVRQLAVVRNPGAPEALSLQVKPQEVYFVELSSVR